MPLAGIGAAVAGDIGAFGAADAAALGAADVGAFGAADVGAFGAADAAAFGGADVAAAAVPDLSATAGLDAANAAFGTFSPDLFAANTADVAAGGLGTDFAGAGVLGGDVGTFGGAASGVDTGFFGGTAGDLFSGAGMGPAGGFDTGFAQPFGDAFSTTDAFGNPVSASGQISDVGNFGGGTAGAQAPAGGGGFQAPIGSEVTATETTTPIVQPDTGIVDTGGPIDQTFNQFTTTEQGASLPVDMANRVGATPVATQSTTLEQAFPGASQSITGDVAANTPASFSAPVGTDFQPGSMFESGGLVPGTGGEAVPADFSGVTPGANTTLSPGGFAYPDTIANVTPSAQMIAGAPDVTPAAALPSPTTVTAAPGAAAAPATAGAATTPGAAGGGISPLTALRAGTLGVNAITAGINLSNALNQPSYPALQPTAYPGSIYSPYYSSSQPGAPGTGGIAGGLAANRLSNALVAGASPQQLEASGLIGQGRATRLQSTYSGIAAQYAKQLGVSEQSLSPGVKRMIAAQALADMNLGGR